MIGGGFSLFGFDVFGMSRRALLEAEKEPSSSQEPSAKGKEDRHEQRLPDHQYSESFFWGMYPVY